MEEVRQDTGCHRSMAGDPRAEHLRFFYLKADFPNFSPWWIDQAKYTDEGWWANGAVMHHLLGHWNVAGDYNPAVAAPVWPVLLGVVFHFTGVSLVAARALNVAVSIATLGVVFFLVRRYSSNEGRDTSHSCRASLIGQSLCLRIQQAGHFGYTCHF